jgi:hypothetical protein
VDAIVIGVDGRIRSSSRFTLDAIREAYDETLRCGIREQAVLFGLVARARIDF